MSVLMHPDIPTGAKCHSRPICKSKQSVDVRRRIHRHSFTYPITIANCTVLECRSCQRYHRFHRPKQLDQVGHIVWPNIQNRPCTRLEKKIRVRMPCLHATPHNMAGTPNNLPYFTVINGRARQLMSATKERVRRRPNT